MSHSRQLRNLGRKLLAAAQDPGTPYKSKRHRQEARKVAEELIEEGDLGIALGLTGESAIFQVRLLCEIVGYVNSVLDGSVCEGPRERTHYLVRALTASIGRFLAEYEAVPPRPVPADAPRVVDAMQQIYHAADQLKRAFAAEVPEAIAIAAFRLGHYCARIVIETSRPAFEAGWKCLESAKAAAVSTHGSALERYRRALEYQAEIDKLMAGNTRLSYNAACQRVAARLGISSKTVKRHTSNPRQK